MSDAAGYGIGAGVALVLIAAFTPLLIWWRNRRLTKVAAQHPRARFVGGVAQAPGGPNTAVMVVDPDALRLVRLGGALIAEWPWSSVRSVREQPVRFGVARSKGLTLEVASQWEPELQFILLRRSWLGASPGRTDDAAKTIAACLERDGPTTPSSQ